MAKCYICDKPTENEKFPCIDCALENEPCGWWALDEDKQEVYWNG